MAKSDHSISPAEQAQRAEYEAAQAVATARDAALAAQAPAAEVAVEAPPTEVEDVPPVEGEAAPDSPAPKSSSRKTRQKGPKE